MYNGAVATGHAVEHGASVAGHDIVNAGHWAYQHRGPIVQGIKTVASDVTAAAPVVDQFADTVDPAHKAMYDGITHTATTIAGATTTAANSQPVANLVKLNWVTDDMHAVGN